MSNPYQAPSATGTQEKRTRPTYFRTAARVAVSAFALLCLIALVLNDAAPYSPFRNFMFFASMVPVIVRPRWYTAVFAVAAMALRPWWYYLL